MPLRSSVLTRRWPGWPRGRAAALRRRALWPAGHAVPAGQPAVPRPAGLHQRRCPSWLQHRESGALRELAQPQRTCWARHRSSGWTPPLPRVAARWNVLGQQTVFGQRDFQSGSGQTCPTTAGTATPPPAPASPTPCNATTWPTPCCWAATCTPTGSATSKPTTTRASSATLGVEFCGTSITPTAAAMRTHCRATGTQPALRIGRPRAPGLRCGGFHAQAAHHHLARGGRRACAGRLGAAALSPPRGPQAAWGGPAAPWAPTLAMASGLRSAG
jgi:hypothetical protein